MRLSQAICGVMITAFAAGVGGGVAGAAVGRFAPSFVLWIYSPTGQVPPPDFQPTEFGFGLGVVSGLFLGVAAGVFLVMLLVIRDAVLSKARWDQMAAQDDFV
jgi:hypothetical protein